MPFGKIFEDMLHRLGASANLHPAWRAHEELYVAIGEALSTMRFERGLFVYVPVFGSIERDAVTAWTFGWPKELVLSYLQPGAFLRDEGFRAVLRLPLPRRHTRESLDRTAVAHIPAARPAYEAMARLLDAGRSAYELGLNGPDGAGNAYGHVLGEEGRADTTADELVWLQAIVDVGYRHYLAIREREQKTDPNFELTPVMREAIAARLRGATVGEVGRLYGLSERDHGKLMVQGAQLLASEAAKSTLATVGAKAVATGRVSRLDYPVKKILLRTDSGVESVEIRPEKAEET